MEMVRISGNARLRTGDCTVFKDFSSIQGSTVWITLNLLMSAILNSIRDQMFIRQQGQELAADLMLSITVPVNGPDLREEHEKVSLLNSHFRRLRESFIGIDASFLEKGGIADVE